MTRSRRAFVRVVGGADGGATIDVADTGVVRNEAGDALAVTAFDSASCRVDGPAGSTTVYFARDRDVLWLFENGATWRVHVDAGPSPTRTASAADASLSAPMPATVVQVRVKAGDAVEQGDTLMVLEAMKMELAIRSPRSARVKAIHCQPGDLVQAGVLLLELE